MNYKFPMPNSDPVRNYSLNLRKQKEVDLQPGDWCVSCYIMETCADTLSFSSQPSALVHTKNHSYNREEVFPANSSNGGALPTAVSKMVTRLVRRYDQDERQPDAAIHWDAIKLVLMKAFAKQGARDFSDEDWLRHIHQGSSKTRFEYCEDSKNSSASLFTDTLVE